MWRLKNETPYAAERGWIRDGDGREIWVVAIKCTYDILPDGQLQLSAKQQPVNDGPVKDPTTSEVLYDTDLGAEKRYADIILNGHAWLPESSRRSPVLAGFRIGSVVRLANIYPERPLVHAVKTNGFIKIPLIYQNMSAGSSRKGESFNPLGRKKPAIEFRHDRDSEIGFGPVPAHWRGRTALAGTCDARWQATRYPLPPEDFNPLFWQVAPAAQQMSIKGGEKVALANLTSPLWHPAAVISFYLPRLSLVLNTSFSDGTTEEHRPRIHTVILEPDYPRVSVVWHSGLPCHKKVNQLKFTRIWEKKRINTVIRRPDPAFPEMETL